MVIGKFRANQRQLLIEEFLAISIIAKSKPESYSHFLLERQLFSNPRCLRKKSLSQIEDNNEKRNQRNYNVCKERPTLNLMTEQKTKSFLRLLFILSSPSEFNRRSHTHWRNVCYVWSHGGQLLSLGDELGILERIYCGNHYITPYNLINKFLGSDFSSFFVILHP